MRNEGLALSAGDGAAHLEEHGLHRVAQAPVTFDERSDLLSLAIGEGKLDAVRNLLTVELEMRLDRFRGEPDRAERVAFARGAEGNA